MADSLNLWRNPSFVITVEKIALSVKLSLLVFPKFVS